MNSFYFSQLKQLDNSKINDLLSGVRRGIEKENIRVGENGLYAHSKHPSSLGSPLLNKNLTLDFSETLLEQITAPCVSRETLFTELSDINTWLVQQLAELESKEYLWPYSMPYLVTQQDIDSIKIADFGSSVSGKMKTIYRQGLVYRYGKAMQLIAGIHYNLSWPYALFDLLGPLEDIPLVKSEPYEQALKSQRYLGVIRNFYRNQWLITLLFGSSPVCFSGSLLRQTKPAYLNHTDAANAYWGDASTSLRLGPIGYQNKAQANINLNFRTIEGYARDLLSATQMPDSNFSCIPVKNKTGDYQQLNNHVLQIENEFYSSIRPKANPKYKERTAVALAKYGIEYIELRALDLDLFSPESISIETSIFCDLWLMHLLLMPSADLTEIEKMAATYNLNVVIAHGRDPNTFCYVNNSLFTIQEQAMKVLEEMRPLAELLDKNTDIEKESYCHVLDIQINKIKDFSLLPSSQIINAWQSQGGDFLTFLLGIQQAHEKTIMQRKLPQSILDHYNQQAHQSLNDEKKLNLKDQETIESYIKNYFSQTI